MKKIFFLLFLLLTIETQATNIVTTGNSDSIDNLYDAEIFRDTNISLSLMSTVLIGNNTELIIQSIKTIAGGMSKEIPLVVYVNNNQEDYIFDIDSTYNFDNHVIMLKSDKGIFEFPHSVKLHSGDNNEFSLIIVNTNSPTSVSDKETSFNIVAHQYYNYINLELPDQRSEIFVYDIKGRLMFSDITSETLYQIDMTSIQTGMYIIKIEGKESSTIKFVYR